jgi:pimeloyl-ACP methyl ester carboxylesterase
MFDPMPHHTAPSNYTHHTAPTQFGEAAGIRFAYRRFANRRSGGEVPASIEEMSQHAVAFIGALGVKKFDALGFSIGGLIAQQFTLDRPDLVRKLILVGAGSGSGEGMASLTPEAIEIFGARYDPADELWLRVFFTPSERSQAAGRKYLERQRAQLRTIRKIPMRT